MVGIGETYVPAFAHAADLSPIAVGLVSTVPIVAGSLLQSVSPMCVAALGSYRRWITVCTTLQATSLLLLCGLALRGHVSAWMLYSLATLYWAGGLGAGPAWNTWIEHLVPKGIRPSFFANRARFCQLGVLVGLISGGLWLEYAYPSRVPWLFAVPFAIAGIARFVSTAYLHGHSEEREWVATHLRTRPTFADSVSAVHESGTVRLISFLWLMQAAVYIAAPYFTPFMLSQLRFSYLQYMTILSLGFVGKSLASPWAGRMVKRFGVHTVLRIGGLGIIPASSLWIVSDSFLFLCSIQVLSGALWACYELAMLLLFTDQIPKPVRMQVLSLYNVGNALAMAIGALVGAQLIGAVGISREAYWTVFAVSSVARLLATSFLPRHLPGKISTSVTLTNRTIAVRPNVGTLERPLLSDADRAACESLQTQYRARVELPDQPILPIVSEARRDEVMAPPEAIQVSA